MREAIAKHTTTYDNPDVRGFSEDERPSVEAQVVDRADEIAYDSHDLDDGLKAQLIHEDDLSQLDLWRHAGQKIRERYANLGRRERKYQTVLFLINMEVTDIIQQTQQRIAELGVETLQDVRACPESLVAFSPAIHEQKRILEDFLMENVYRHYRVARMANKARHFIKRIFEAYAQNTRQLPPDYQEWAKQQGIHRAVCDYVAGMTDRFAQDEYVKLFYPYERA